MKTVEELKEEIIERYNMGWEGEDSMGLIEEAKANFIRLVDELIAAVREDKPPNY